MRSPPKLVTSCPALFSVCLTAVLLANFCTPAHAGLCVPLSQCPLSHDKLTLPSQTAIVSCQLVDGSHGVICQTPADYSVSSRFSSRSNEKCSIRFLEEDTEADSPLVNKLSRDEIFIVAANQQEKEEALNAVERHLKIAGQQLTLEKAKSTSSADSAPEKLQRLFSKVQDPRVQNLAKQSLESTLVLQELFNKKQLAIETVAVDVSSDQTVNHSFASFPSTLLPKPASPITLIDDTLRVRDGFVEKLTSSSSGVDFSDDIVFDNQLNSVIPGCSVPAPPVCPAAPQLSDYRQFNGQCNNPIYSDRGAALSGFARLFPASYADGIWSVRTRSVVAGHALPSPRLISSRVVTTTRRHDLARTLSIMLFGQFVNHDFISTPTFSRAGSCCDESGRFPVGPIDSKCIPIRVEPDDPYFSRFAVTCLNQVRSMTSVDSCAAGPKSQLNQVSHYLDASTIYGSSEQRVVSLRTFSGDGKLNTSAGNLLPLINGAFLSGEDRMSENPGLTFLHTVWTREHNRLATALKERHPHWHEERLFQESRRLLIAEYQHVIYNELVPVIVGRRYAQKHGLLGAGLLGRSRPFSYSPHRDARVTSEFSTAAFRYGHSQVDDVFLLRSESGKIVRALPIEDIFFKPQLLQLDGFMAQMARAIVQQPPRAVDTTFSAVVRDHLFSPKNTPGFDLVALNINRGRDHGLPPYTVALQNCRRHKIAHLSWKSLDQYIDTRTLAQLRSVYRHVDDVDLYMGAIAETRAEGALVGPTFQCIIGEQFFNSRYGDRFFYDNQMQPHSFSEQQLRQIRRTSWARILCDNIADLNSVQPLAFFSSSFTFNSIESCQSAAIDSVDLSVF